MRMIWVAGFLLGCFAFVGCESNDDETSATPWTVAEGSDYWWLSLVNVGEERYAVGGTPTEGVMIHDGGDGVFAPVDLGADVGLLNWVHAFADGSLVTVGYDGVMLSSEDGSDWSRSNLATEQKLWGVWGASTNDVWAVGGNGINEGNAVVFRGPIGALEPVEIPELERPNVNAWFKVWGSGPDDVYIVGQKGAMLHWDGNQLSEMGVGLTDDLIGIWGTGPDKIAVVGGRGNGVIALFDGESWRGIKLSPLTGLNGVWFRGNTVHAVGVDEAKVVKIDFTTGEQMEEENFLGIFLPEAEGIDLHAIHGSASGRLSALGGNFILQTGPFRGVIVHRSLGGNE